MVVAISDESVTEKEITALYAVAIRMNIGTVLWDVVNKAIIQRWSLTALKRIKHRAWQAVEAAGEL